MDASSPAYVEVPFSETAPVLDTTFTLLADIGTTGPIADMVVDDGPADSDTVGEGRMGGLPAFRLGGTVAAVPSGLGVWYGSTRPASVVSGLTDASSEGEGEAYSQRVCGGVPRAAVAVRARPTAEAFSSAAAHGGGGQAETGRRRSAGTDVPSKATEMGHVLCCSFGV